MVEEVRRQAGKQGMHEFDPDFDATRSHCILGLANGLALFVVKQRSASWHCRVRATSVTQTAATLPDADCRLVSAQPLHCILMSCTSTPLSCSSMHCTSAELRLSFFGLGHKAPLQKIFVHRTDFRPFGPAGANREYNSSVA